MQISAKFVNNCHYSVKQWHTLVFVKVSIYFFVTVFLQNSTVQCLSVCINLMRCFLLDCIFYEILYICVFVFHTLSGDCFLYRFFIVLFGLTSFYVCVIVLCFHVDCPIVEIQYAILVLSHKCKDIIVFGFYIFPFPSCLDFHIFAFYNSITPHFAIPPSSCEFDNP